MRTARPTLLESLAAWPDSTTSSRPVPGWDHDPVLGRFLTPAAAAHEAAVDSALFAHLAHRVEDTTATTVCLSVVAGWLMPVGRTWARNGLGGEDLADAEAALVVEALTALRAHPNLQAERIAQLAWHRVHNQRRTARARAARHVALTDRLDPRQLPAAPADPLRAALSVLSDWLATRAVNVSTAAFLWTAVCGWPAAHAAQAAGCPTGAWRSRQARALRIARAAISTEGSW